MDKFEEASQPIQPGRPKTRAAVAAVQPPPPPLQSNENNNSDNNDRGNGDVPPVAGEIPPGGGVEPTPADTHGESAPEGNGENAPVPRHEGDTPLTSGENTPGSTEDPTPGTMCEAGENPPGPSYPIPNLPIPTNKHLCPPAKSYSSCGMAAERAHARATPEEKRWWPTTTG